MTKQEAIEWARGAEEGEYLIEYEDTGLSAAQDPGSRCGFDDAELDAIRCELARRDLSLEADDQGLIAVEIQRDKRYG